MWEDSFNVLLLQGSDWMNYSWRKDVVLGSRVVFEPGIENGVYHVTCAGVLSSVRYNDSMHFFFRGTNGLVYECVRSGPDWKLYDVSKQALEGESVTSVRPSTSDLSVIVVGQVIHIFFIGIDHRLRELYKTPGKLWRHVSLRRHVGGSVCSLPEQSSPFACVDMDQCLHVFFVNDERRIGECYWKLKRSKWRVFDTSEYIPHHGPIEVIFDVQADEGPHLLFASADGLTRTITYHHVHWTDNSWISAYWGTKEGIQLEHDPPGTPMLLGATFSSQAEPSAPPPAPLLPPPPIAPPPPVKLIISKATSPAKPPLVVRLPMKDGKYRKEMHKYQPVRLVIVSDTHNYPERVGALPSGDILVHCGDFTVYGKGSEISDFATWLDEQTQFKHKVVIAGNHETNPGKAKKLMESHCIWLDNKLVTILGINFYGTTWGCDYDQIPTKGVDVLLTHRPPSGHGDVIYTGDSRGSDTLAHTVRKMQPILHVFGHNHEGFGATCDAHTVYVNAAACMGSAKSTARRGSIVVDIYPDLKSKYGDIQNVAIEDLSSSSIDSVVAAIEKALPI